MSTEDAPIVRMQEPELVVRMREPELIVRMQELEQKWSTQGDQRAIFLRCYSMMTNNMLGAIADGEFVDPPWVHRLLVDFAGYYFYGLTKFEESPAYTPSVWRIAHEHAIRDDVHILQHLLLGINAHINYDLVLVVAELLQDEWQQLTKKQRRQRHADFCRVNVLIARTIDAVQSQILAPSEAQLERIDRLLGNVDEWLISRLITHWRDHVWDSAIALIEHPSEQRAEYVIAVESNTLRRAEAILMHKGLLGLTELL